MSGRDSRSGNFVRACAGHRDWTIVAEHMVKSLDDAFEIEAIFKTAFDPAHIDRVGADESDFVLLPEPTLSDEKIAGLHPLIRDLYMAARSRMHPLPRERNGPYVTDQQREI